MIIPAISYAHSTWQYFAAFVHVKSEKSIPSISSVPLTFSGVALIFGEPIDYFAEPESITSVSLGFFLFQK